MTENYVYILVKLDSQNLLDSYPDIDLILNFSQEEADTISRDSFYAIINKNLTFKYLNFPSNNTLLLLILLMIVLTLFVVFYLLRQKMN